MSRIRQINDSGIGLWGFEGEKLRDIRVYAENGSVQLWVEVGQGDSIEEAMQYLTPSEAMAFAKAFERCAVQALKGAR